MLIINGGIAMLNGLLLASYSVFCSCIMGGTCCGGVCQCGEGECCDGEWHTDEGTCCENEWQTGSGICCCLPNPCIILAYSENGIPGENGHCQQTLLPGSVQTVTVPDGYHYVRITGSVDDELLIDGVVIQPGEFAGNGPCNNAHNVELLFAQEGSFTVACADNHGIASGYNLAICFYINDAWRDGLVGYTEFKCWHPTGENPCVDGKHLGWISPYCCGCIEAGAELCCQPGIPIHEKQDGECKQRCCDPASPASCTDEYPADCANTSLEGSCYTDGCPGSCCTENAEGTEVACVDVDAADCVSPAIGNNAIACGATACLGQCCEYVDDVYTGTGVVSLADCIAAGGEFQGVGTTVCLNCGGQTGPQSHRCRAPFDECCCEEKTTTGAGLVFTAPRNKERLPALDAGKSKQFTIELRTESDIMIHGELFSAYSQCLTTIICHDQFNVEPVPCGSNFANLWIKVCWNDHGYTREELPFPECQGLTIWLGNCGGTELQFCQTYTTYSGNGLTSDVDIILYGSAHITADGTGPLVISEPITNQGTCARTLTIDGISPQLNSINGGITDVPGGEKLTVVKDGVGTWRFGASSSFEGQLFVKQGTILAAVGAQASGDGVFGAAELPSLLPMLGDSTAGATGFAAILLTDNLLVISRGINVAALGSGGTQVAILGGANTSGTSRFATSADIRISRDVTLQAATGGTVNFGNAWLNSTGTGNPEYSYTIGTAGNLGTVRLSSTLATNSGTVSVNYGTLLFGASNLIASTTPVSIGSSGGSGTLALDAKSLTLSQLSFNGSGSFVTNSGAGALTMTSAATITVQSGTGHQISSNMVLASNTTVHVPLGATLLISGNITGAFTLTRTGCGTLTLTGTNTSTIVNIPC